MANLNELRKYLTHTFSTGVYTGKDYKTFQTKYSISANLRFFSLHTFLSNSFLARKLNNFVLPKIFTAVGLKK